MELSSTEKQLTDQKDVLEQWNLPNTPLTSPPYVKQGSQSLRVSLSDLEYSFFWSGKLEGERREAGVGFVIKKDIVTKLTEMPRPVSDSIMTTSKDNFATIISVYAPTMTNPDENKEASSTTSWQLCSVASLV